MWAYFLCIIALASAKCPESNCFKNDLTCDEQIKKVPEVSCERLEAFGCQCGGCTCPEPPSTSTTTTFKYPWSKKLNSRCSGTVKGDVDKGLSVTQCQENCAKDLTCDGFNYVRASRQCNYLAKLSRGTLTADKGQDCYVYDRPGVALLTTESPAMIEMWSKCGCPDNAGICVDALNFLYTDTSAANCSRRQAALDCALMPQKGSPHGMLCNGRYTPYGQIYPDATCKEIALSYNDKTCSLSYNPNALVPTTPDPDIEDLPAARELLTKCTVCAKSPFYCRTSLEMVLDLRKKSLVLDRCSQIQHAFECGFVPIAKEPRGFLDKKVGAGGCQALARQYSFKGCNITCSAGTTSSAATTPAAGSGCKGSCLDATCDGFVRRFGVTCPELEATGCDCSGCTSCTAASVPPKNYVIKVGFECGRVGLLDNRVTAGGTATEPSFIDKNTKVETCVQRCNAHAQCGGFTYVLPRLECEYFANMTANVERSSTDSCYTKIDFTPPTKSTASTATIATTTPTSTTTTTITTTTTTTATTTPTTPTTTTITTTTTTITTATTTTTTTATTATATTATTTATTPPTSATTTTTVPPTTTIGAATVPSIAFPTTSTTSPPGLPDETELSTTAHKRARTSVAVVAAQTTIAPTVATTTVVLAVAIAAVTVIAVGVAALIVMLRKAKERREHTKSLQVKTLLDKNDWTQSSSSNMHKYDIELHDRIPDEPYTPPSVNFGDDEFNDI